MAEKTRYSDGELEEFRQIILAKLDKARRDYDVLKASITHEDNNDTMDTSPTFKVLEEGATTLSKEEAGSTRRRSSAAAESLHRTTRESPGCIFLKRCRMSSSEKGTMALRRSKTSMGASMLISVKTMSKADANWRKKGQGEAF